MLLARWTIGNTTAAGYECLKESISSFKKLYECNVIVCHNCDPTVLNGITHDLFDQRSTASTAQIKPAGVSWKLYPPRIDESVHEIVIDNDIIFRNRIKEIDTFLDNDCTLLLQDDTRTYGRFDKFVPMGYEINSGIYGMPPNFSLQKYVNFYCRTDWVKNALGSNKESITFDEQGLVALSLLDYHNFLIIPNTSVTNCEHNLKIADAMHFIGLNRRSFHRPFSEFKLYNTRMYL